MWPNLLASAMASAMTSPPTASLVLLTHHKFGSVLAHELRSALCGLRSDGRCLTVWRPPRRIADDCCRHSPVTASINGAVPQGATKLATVAQARSMLLARVMSGTSFVHIIRDPYQAILSGYLYHRRGAEGYWSRKPMPRSQGLYTPLRGTAKVHLAVGKGALGAGPRAWLRPNSTYYQLLRQLSLRDGLHAEAIRTLHATDGLGRAWVLWQAAQTEGLAGRSQRRSSMHGAVNATVARVCLEAFTGSAPHVASATRALLCAFDAACETPDHRKLIGAAVRSQLRYATASSGGAEGGKEAKAGGAPPGPRVHATARGAQRDEALVLLKEVDAEHFGGRIGRMAAVFGCASEREQNSTLVPAIAGPTPPLLHLQQIRPHLASPALPPPWPRRDTESAASQEGGRAALPR